MRRFDRQRSNDASTAAMSSRESARSAAAALSVAVSDRRTPGIGITTGLLASIQARTRRWGDTPRREATAASPVMAPSAFAPLSPPKGEYGKKAIPCAAQAASIPSRSGLLYMGFQRFWTLAIGTMRRA